MILATFLKKGLPRQFHILTNQVTSKEGEKRFLQTAETFFAKIQFFTKLSRKYFSHNPNHMTFSFLQHDFRPTFMR